MSLLVVGLSHRSAPVSVLDRAALPRVAVDALLDDVHEATHVSEAAVIATCNRLEVYADVAKFHGGVDEVSALLARHTGLGLAELTRHLYVHYDDRAAHHLFAVAAGLDSMAVGETQVLGQVRTSLRHAQDAGTAGRVLNEAFSAALRSAKRVHAETGLDRVGRSLVELGLAAVEPVLGGIGGRRAVVVGTGSMASLAATTLWSAGASVTVAGRTPASAASLAAKVAGHSVPLEDLAGALDDADLLVSCTGATGVVVPAWLVGEVMVGRPHRPLGVVDLALPHDVDPAVRDVPGVVLADLATLSQYGAQHDAARYGAGEGYPSDVEQARQVVAEEVALFLGERRADGVAATVVALRTLGDDVVEAELQRLGARVPTLDEAARDEVASTVRRVVDKLLHAPTVRVKELAAGPDGPAYEAALRELFALDRTVVAAVTRPGEEDAR